MARYALTKCPTPVFNTSELATCFGGEDGMSLSLDDQGLLRCVETILFPQSRIELVEKVPSSSIWQIRTEEYPYKGPFYTDERFLTFCDREPSRRQTVMPSKEALLKALHSMPSFHYVWGGNWPHENPLMNQLFPSKKSMSLLDPKICDTWRLKGFDCSGLPYYLTNGLTPRNTSSLLHFGKPVSIEGKNIPQIIDQLQSLDFIVWQGHVVWVLDRQFTIESRHPVGIVRVGMEERLAEIMKDRKPVDDWNQINEPRFVVRRWHPEVIT